jgi:hypothetical protein
MSVLENFNLYAWLVVVVVVMDQLCVVISKIKSFIYRFNASQRAPVVSLVT